MSFFFWLFFSLEGVARGDDKRIDMQARPVVAGTANWFTLVGIIFKSSEHQYGEVLILGNMGEGGEY